MDPFRCPVEVLLRRSNALARATAVTFQGVRHLIVFSSNGTSGPCIVASLYSLDAVESDVGDEEKSAALG
jgi:hypothetical protein